MFKTITILSNELKFISIFIGKLGSHTQDWILDAYGVDNFSFENLEIYFRKQEEQDRYK